MLAGIEHFVAVAEARSFRAGAARLGISPAAVSKAVARLEETLGVRLLERSTRSVVLTPEGEVYLAHCRQALDALQAGADHVSASREVAAGAVRLSASPVLARPLVQGLPRLRSRHPRVEVELSLTDRLARLVEEEVDVAVRLGPLEDSALVARRLRSPRWVTVASPALLARVGSPRRPAELSGLPCLGFVAPGGGVVGWTFAGEEPPPLSFPVRLDLGEHLVTAAVAGLGLAQVFDFMAAEDLKQGRLAEVLAEYGAPGPPLHALWRPGRQQVPRVRVLLDWLVEVLG